MGNNPMPPTRLFFFCAASSRGRRSKDPAARSSSKRTAGRRVKGKVRARQCGTGAHVVAKDYFAASAAALPAMRPKTMMSV